MTFFERFRLSPLAQAAPPLPPPRSSELSANGAWLAEQTNTTRLVAAAPGVRKSGLRRGRGRSRAWRRADYDAARAEIARFAASCGARIVALEAERTRVAASLRRALGGATSRLKSSLYDMRSYATRGRVERWHRANLAVQALFDAYAALRSPDDPPFRLLEWFLGDRATLTNDYNRLYVTRQSERRRDILPAFLTHEQLDAALTEEPLVSVVAGAGAGKTTVLGVRTRWLVKERGVDPRAILLLTFSTETRAQLVAEIRKGTAAADPMRRVRISTFHALGRRIANAALGKRPVHRFARDRELFERFADAEMARLLDAGDPTLRNFLVSQLRPNVQPSRYATVREYFEALSAWKPRTMRGEYVRSSEECAIANWLFVNNVEYEYERPYFHEREPDSRKQYAPDFYLPAGAIWYEHFATDSSLKTAPPWMKGYVDQVQWKLRVHGVDQARPQDGTPRFFHTTSGDFRAGCVFDVLSAALAQRGVKPRPMSGAEIIRALGAQKRASGLARLIVSFHTRVRAKGLDARALRDRAAMQPDPERCAAFLGVYARIGAAYAAALRAEGAVDYDDMIDEATRVLADGATTDFAHVMIDEYQDVSEQQMRFVERLGSAGTHRFVVGDDWQAIYGFRGAEARALQDFGAHDARHTRYLLTESQRFPQEVAEVTNRFILRNSAQIPKTMRSNRIAGRACIEVVAIERDKQSADTKARRRDAALRIAREHVLRSPDDGVFFLSRYGRERVDRAEIPSARTPMRSLTMHGAKGLGAELVILVDAVGGDYGFPNALEDDPVLAIAGCEDEPIAHAEERRLFYVALTRTKGRVVVLTDASEPSAFVTEIAEDRDNVVGGLSPDAEAVAAACPVCGSDVVRRHGNYVCRLHPVCETFHQTCPSCRVAPLLPVDGRLRCGCGLDLSACPECAQGYPVLRRRDAKAGGRGPRVDARFVGCSKFGGHPKFSCGWSAAVAKHRTVSRTPKYETFALDVWNTNSNGDVAQNEFVVRYLDREF